MARYNTPIWQDKSVLTNAHVYILKDGQWVDTGRHFTALPGQTMPSYLINRIAEDYVKSKAPTFNIMSLYSAYTETQPDAYQVFKTDYNNTEYGMYNDWSYEIRTDTGHCQNAPVNRHADARQILTYGRWGVSGESITVKELLMPVIKATPNMLNLGAEQTYGQTIIIESNKVGELFLPAWLHANETAITVGTNAIYVYPDENTGWEDREANIIVKCEGYEEDYDYIPVVYVSQAGIVPYFYVSPVEKSISWESGMTYFLVNTNVSYSAATSQSWVSYSGSTPATPHNYNTFFNVSANTGDNREAVITFTYQVSSGETATASVVLRQEEAPYFYVSPVEKSVEWESGTTAFLVSTNMPYSAATSQSWITYSGSTPASSHNYNAIFIYSANTGDNRDAVITFTYQATSSSTATTSVVLRQAHIPPIPIPSDEIWYTNTGGTVSSPYSTGVTIFGANIISNTYTDKGVIKFDNSVTKIGDRAFYINNKITSFVIPNSVTEIGIYAFRENSELSAITLSNSVTTIGNYAFRADMKLSAITLSNSVTHIGDAAFNDCISISAITFPSGITYIGIAAFAGCTSLATINYNGTMSQWANVSKGYGWHENAPATVVHCTDGNVPL